MRPWRDAWMPFLFRATPQHGDQRDELIARKPTRRRQGILETARQHLDGTNRPQHVHPILCQGMMRTCGGSAPGGVRSS